MKSIVLILLITLSLVYPFYWFQSGAIANSYASNNNGASITIEAVNQSPTYGSFGFWVGEHLNNNDFIQIGYVITNSSAYYPKLCTINNCTYEYLPAHSLVWFYEYFYNNGNTFLGAFGPEGSIIPNTNNTFSFYSYGNTWYFKVNNNVVGSINLGTSTSGPNVPAAIAELANTTSNNQYMNPVIFKNFSVYKYGIWIPVGKAYSSIGYGVGSQENEPNPYGVEEINNRINEFEVGSSLLNTNIAISKHSKQ